MNDRDNLALVKSAGVSLQNVAPSAKRVLGEMVTEALALANKRTFRVLTCTGDPEGWGEMIRDLVQIYFNDERTVEFIDAQRTSEIYQLLRQQSFDLVFSVINNMINDLPEYSGSGVPQNARFLTHLKRRLNVPIIAECTHGPNPLSDFNLPEFLRDGGVTWFERFQGKPYAHDHYCNTLEKALRNSLDAAKSSRTVVRHKPSRPLRFILADEPCVLDSIRTLIQFTYKDAEILTFTRHLDALEAASRVEPDILTVDYNNPDMSGAELIEILLKKDAQFGMIMISAYMEIAMENGYLSRIKDAPNVSLIAKPFRLGKLRSTITKHLGRQRPCVSNQKVSKHQLGQLSQPLVESSR